MPARIVGALRVAVIAEGAGETVGDVSMPPQPGDDLWDAALGSAHILVQRLIADLSTAGVRFVQPPRTRGRIARGSDLIHRTTLRQLLTWGDSSLRPHLTIVLVDRDGEANRPAVLAKHVEGIAHAHVIAVAVEAFESWLASDESNPESVPAGEIKRRVSREHEERIAMARTMDLGRQVAKCPSLAEFRRALSMHIPGILEGL
jgi:hypothetical protein